jgi:undecaprenyl-diphosphatase
MTELVQAILLGIVQGLTEFIPVSSSAHLIIVPWLLQPLTGIEDFGLAFDLALHLGTLVAVLWYFWSDWRRYIGAGLASLRELRIGGDKDRVLAWLLLVGCIPGGVAGVVGDTAVEGFFHSPNAPHRNESMIVIALLMVALAIILWLAERLARHERTLASITLRDALLIGLAQAFALLPGVSRSGSTITMGLALGLTRETAARFSFLLAAPIIAGAGGKKVLDAFGSGDLDNQAGVFLAGFVAAALVGYLCIKYLLRYLQSNTTMPFVLYRLVVGAAILALVAAGFGA